MHEMIAPPLVLRCSVSEGMRGQWSNSECQATNEYPPPPPTIPSPPSPPPPLPSVPVVQTLVWVGRSIGPVAGGARREVRPRSDSRCLRQRLGTLRKHPHAGKLKRKSGGDISMTVAILHEPRRRCTLAPTSPLSPLFFFGVRCHRLTLLPTTTPAYPRPLYLCCLHAAAVILQECERMNLLVGEIVRTLTDLCLAFKVTQPSRVVVAEAIHATIDVAIFF